MKECKDSVFSNYLKIFVNIHFKDPMDKHDFFNMDSIGFVADTQDLIHNQEDLFSNINNMPTFYASYKRNLCRMMGNVVDKGWTVKKTQGDIIEKTWITIKGLNKMIIEWLTTLRQETDKNLLFYIADGDEEETVKTLMPLLSRTGIHWCVITDDYKKIVPRMQNEIMDNFGDCLITCVNMNGSGALSIYEPVLAHIIPIISSNKMVDGRINTLEDAFTLFGICVSGSKKQDSLL